jgi:hypothetical protein
MSKLSLKRAGVVGAALVAVMCIPGGVQGTAPDAVSWDYVQVWMRGHRFHRATAHTTTRDRNGDRVVGAAVSGAVEVRDGVLMARVPIPGCRLSSDRFERYNLDGAVGDAVTGSSRPSSPQRVGLATMEELAAVGQCGTTAEGGALGTRTLNLWVFCDRPGDQAGLGDLARQTSIAIRVNCDPNYRTPSTVPYGFRHTCPSGYVVQSTGRQVYDAASPDLLCIRATLDRTRTTTIVAPAPATQPGGMCSTVTATPVQTTPTTTTTQERYRLP